MGCLCCGATAEIGALCRACAKDVAPCEGLIADHVRSTIPSADAEAWAVDGFGNPHALAATTLAGRQHAGGLVALASSVSREHAELRKTDAGWVVRDLGSRNGTFVDGVRVQGRVTLPERAVLKLGDVALWFLAEVAMEPAPPESLATGSIGGLVRYNLAHATGELCVIGSADPAAGGSLLARAKGEAAWKERGLSPLELQLLRALCVRAAEEAGSPSAVRGCVPTKQLARDLPFQSKYANEENVRQVVRRVRELLGEAGAEGVLAVAPGRGYYLTCSVSDGAPDRP
jgi:hypothetical protein